MRLEYALAARRDRSEIWRWNAKRYGTTHATEYARFLTAEIRALKDDPRLGRPVPDLPDLYQLVIKKRLGGYGHIVFYRVNGEMIQIVRVLHTARDWPNLLQEP